MRRFRVVPITVAAVGVIALASVVGLELGATISGGQSQPAPAVAPSSLTRASTPADALPQGVAARLDASAPSPQALRLLASQPGLTLYGGINSADRICLVALAAPSTVAWTCVPRASYGTTGVPLAVSSGGNFSLAVLVPDGYNRALMGSTSLTIANNITVLPTTSNAAAAALPKLTISGGPQPIDVDVGHFVVRPPNGPTTSTSTGGSSG